ncbi:uncharacterized protein LOC144665410 [Oculina patagonica]
MREVYVRSKIFVLLLSSHLAFQQPLHNSSEVSVSSVTDSLLNVTTAPTTAVPPAHVEQLPAICPQKFSCRKRCDDTFQGDDLNDDVAHCHCDQDCLKFQDCCADFTHFCKPNQENQGMPISQNSNYSCVKLSTESGQEKGVFMITTCAANWKGSEDVRLKCLEGSKSSNRSFTSKNIIEDIPVASLIRPDGTQYRNIYCGICSNEAAILLPSWQLKFRCNIKAPPSYYNNEEKLDFFLKYCPARILKPHKHFKIRTCLPVESTCSVANEHEDGCMKGKSGLVYSQTTTKNYKNLNCLLCNGAPSATSQCGPEDTGQLFNPKSFEIIMDFSQGQGNQEVRQPKISSVLPTCSTDKVFDPHLETCEAGSVVNPSSLAVRDTYRVKLWMHPSGDEKWPINSEEFHHAICARFALDFSQIDVISITTEDSSTAVAFNLYAGAGKTSKSSKDYETLNVSVLLNFNESFSIVIANKTWIILRITHRQLSCAKPEEFAPGEFHLLPFGKALVKGAGNKTAELLPPNKFFIKHNNNSNDSLLVCRSQFSVLCPFSLLLISSSEYRIVANDSLLHTTTGRVYTTEEYDLVDDLKKAWICTNYTNYTKIIYTKTKIETENTTENTFLRYFTIVGFSLSIFTLVLTLMIHCIFSELRNPLPGKNLMNLCLALLLAQFMWLFGSGDTDKPTFCTVMAAVIHYLILVSFACTAVIAFDTRRTFSSQISKAPSSSLGQSRNLRFLTYSCLAWGVPLLFVVGCVLLDHFQVVFIGYGNENACWIVNSNAKIVTFATPIGCVLVYNVTAFSHTVWAINSARKQTRRVKSPRQDQRAVLKIYVRLISLMGFTWFFSFSAELIHKALLYPFVILTTLQGVYIFVAFICKTRVFKLMMERFPRSRKDALASTQHTASTECRSLPPYSPYRSERETHM